ncbi:unnamed protein product [Alopecurus aequalis]
MARKKVNVAYIENDANRRSTGKKRAMGAMKKAGELATLCDVEVCLIIVPQDGPLQAYPSLPDAMRTVDRYKSMPEVDQCKKKMDGQDYVRDRMAKMQEQLRKAQHENRQREGMLRLHHAMASVGRPDLAGLPIEHVISLGWTTESLLKKIKDAIVYRGGQLVGSVVVKDDPWMPYAADINIMEAPHVQQGGWLMEVVKAGWDLDALPPPYNGNHSMIPSGGSYDNVDARGDLVMQPGNNLDARFPWALQGTDFLPV